jgi:drug/metabolite transporter (DMT)-like permease
MFARINPAQRLEYDPAAMELWVLITVAAAFLQNLRSALQRQLTARLSAEGAAYVRFLFALPFVAIYLLGLDAYLDAPLPAPNLAFAGYVVLGGGAQIVATVFLIRSFATRNFAVGTAYSKTETMQAALIGFVLLGEGVGVLAALGILISLLGVVVLSRPARAADGWFGAGAMWGVLSGSAFAVSIVCYRAASLSLAPVGVVAQAAVTLGWALLFQTLAMGGYLLLRRDGELIRVARAWRPALLVGASGMLASAGWFTAVAIQQAAYVRAVGQVELVFTFIISLAVFRERLRIIDIAGVVLIVAGILLLLLD